MSLITVVIGRDFEEHSVSDDGEPGVNLSLAGRLPEGTALVVLCQRGDGYYAPFSIRLPHQVYMRDLHRAGPGGLVVFPIVGEPVFIRKARDA